MWPGAHCPLRDGRYYAVPGFAAPLTPRRRRPRGDRPVATLLWKGDGRVRDLLGRMWNKFKNRRKRQQLRFALADTSAPERLQLTDRDGEHTAEIRAGTVVDDSLVVLLNHLTGVDG